MSSRLANRPPGPSQGAGGSSGSDATALAVVNVGLGGMLRRRRDSSSFFQAETRRYDMLVS